MKHTQGPWRISSIPGHQTDLVNDKGEIVFRIRSGMMPSYVDGRVLQAAPELLRSAQDLISALLEKNSDFQQWDTVKDLMKVINKTKPNGV